MLQLMVLRELILVTWSKDLVLSRSKIRSVWELTIITRVGWLTEGPEKQLSVWKTSQNMNKHVAN